MKKAEQGGRPVSSSRQLAAPVSQANRPVGLLRRPATSAAPATAGGPPRSRIERATNRLTAGKLPAFRQIVRFSTLPTNTADAAICRGQLLLPLDESALSRPATQAAADQVSEWLSATLDWITHSDVTRLLVPLALPSSIHAVTEEVLGEHRGGSGPASALFCIDL